MTDLRETSIKGYELEECLGEGAHGAVYRAYQPQVGREVAIKIILPEYANQPDFIRRFEAEAQLVAQLEHLHIVPLYDYWRDPGVAYLVMRLMKGGSLEDSLRERGPWEPAEAARLVDQIASALEAAHKQGVVHRDLKPANILLDEDGNAYLSDFGIAKQIGVETSITQTGAIVGTPAYITPEQIQSQPVTAQTDIYALGVVLYELLVGGHPFPDTPTGELVVKHLSQPLPYVRESRFELPAAVDGVIQRATAKEPEARYSDALSLAADLHRALDLEVALPTIPEEEIYNPYKGLRAFQEADADDFFGRDALIGQLIARLIEIPSLPPVRGGTEGGGQNRFLAVVGPSGSGKSSVVKAGLLPALRKGALPGSEEWFITEMVPGAHPLEELERALMRVAADPDLNLQQQLSKDSFGLLRAAWLALPSRESELLLVIDQFEELFILVEDEDERAHFLELLHTAVMDKDSIVRVVVTLRADFYDRPLMYPEFGQLVEVCTAIVLPLTAEELEQAIRAPAERVGAVLEQGLVTAITADVADQPGALPLLQYALTELFERREGRMLTCEAYQSIGGVLGALGRRAEEVYASLDQDGKDFTHQLILRLVTLGEGTEDTRRRVPRSELEGLMSDQGIGDREKGAVIGDQYSVISRVIDVFGSARLLTFDRDPVTREPTVEVAHEALLQEWRRLREWLDGSRADIRMQRVLGNAAAEWLEADRDAGFLLRGSRLDQFEAWVADTDIALTVDEQAFMDASLAERRAREAAEAERQVREAAMERRSRNFLRGLVVVLAVAAVVAVALSAFAIDRSNQAQRNAATATIAQGQAQYEAATAVVAQEQEAAQRVTAQAEANARATAEAEAQEQARISQRQAEWNHSLALAAESQIALQANDRDLALALALAAIQIEDPPYQAQIALSEAAYAPGTVRLFSGYEDAVYGAELSPDGRSILSFGADHSIHLWDLQTGEEIRQIEIEGEHPDWFNLDFSPDGRQALVSLEDYSLVLVDLESGETIQRMTGHNALVWGLAFSPDGQTVLSASASVEDPPPEDLDNSLWLWDLGTGADIRRFEGHSDFVASIAFAPDGRSALSGSWADGSLIQWDLETGGILNKWDYEPVYIAISPDGRTALFALELIFHVILLDLETGEEIHRLEGHNTDIWSTEIDPQGQVALSGDSSGEIRVWDLGTGELLERFNAHSGTVSSFNFSPDGETFISSSWDTTMRLWSLNSGAEVQRFSDHVDQVRDVAYSPDGSTAISVEFGALHLWDLETRIEVQRIELPSDGWEVAYTPDGKSALVTLMEEGGVMQVDLATGEQLQRLGGEGQPTEHQGWVDAVAVSPDGKRALSGSQGEEGDSLFLWDLESGEVIMSFQTGEVNSVDISPDGRTALSGGLPFEEYVDVMTLWDLESGEAIRQFEGHNSLIFEVAYSPDGETALSASWDASLILWDLESGEIIHQLLGHTDAVRAAAISPDGRTAVSGSKDGTLILWDLETGEAIRRYHGHNGRVNSVDFSPDGRSVLSGADDGVMIEWRIDDTLEELLEWTQANRYLYELSCSERAQYGIEPLCEE